MRFYTDALDKGPQLRRIRFRRHIALEPFHYCLLHHHGKNAPVLLGQPICTSLPTQPIDADFKHVGFTDHPLYVLPFPAKFEHQALLKGGGIMGHQTLHSEIYAHFATLNFSALRGFSVDKHAFVNYQPLVGNFKGGKGVDLAVTSEPRKCLFNRFSLRSNGV